MLKIPAYHHSSRPDMEITHDVVHYTGGGSGWGLANWWAKEESRVSAHFIICRDGTIIQCVELHRKAWHAGVSKTLRDDVMTKNVNRFSVGYELANRGLLHSLEGIFHYKYGGDFRVYKGPEPVFGRVFKRHRAVEGFWEPYPQAQIDGLKKAIAIADDELCNRRTLVGHKNIAPGRKLDPGPLFPWGQFNRD